MGPTDNLGYLLRHLAAVMGRQTDQALQEQLGIGLSQYKILMVLDGNPYVQQRFIAGSLGQTEAGISRQIKLLSGKGLLSTRQDPSNRRQRITSLTPMGTRLTEAATAIIGHSFGPEYAEMGEDQLRQLIVKLQKLHTIVCRPGKTGACDHSLGI